MQPADQPAESAAEPAEVETYNPWTIVHLVFEHLSDQGLHPTLGEGGDPGRHAAALLSALTVQPSAEGNKAVRREVRSQLAEIRAAVLGEQPETTDGPVTTPSVST